ncbi:MAG: hypothetical protein HOP08_00020 [Cyclobacteriaceae bacterium]|nr:hypothetical protein [Cyclobacteriaceae bacterium]
MDSSGFYLAVKNFTNLTAEEAKEIDRLSSEYPYSQILHLLKARIAKDLSLPNQADLLHESAVYSTDRVVLKDILTSPKKEKIQALVPPPVVKEVSKPKEVVPVAVAVIEPLHSEVKQTPKLKEPEPEIHPIDDITLTGDALRSDLMQELNRLQKLKHDFAVSFEDFQKSGTYVESKTSIPKEPSSDPLLEEIQSTKKKLKIDNPKQKEQNEIIDQFIKTSPIIPKPKPITEPKDLSEDSGMFSDNIVSETLVGILLKQGKKEKAIEVLKKLIWKFPQKKAYFAAQIENLKN